VEVVEEIEIEAEDLDVTPENIDEDALRDDVSVDEIDEEADEVENVDQDGFNKSAVTDVWTHGRELVQKDNVKQMRNGQVACQERKKQKMPCECIFSIIKQMLEALHSKRKFHPTF
jgi:hypothetical protein